LGENVAINGILEHGSKKNFSGLKKTDTNLLKAISIPSDG
jgi:hypothetical protein